MLQLVELLFEGLHLDIQHLGLAGLELVGLSLPGRGLERGEMQMGDLPADLYLLRLAEPCAVEPLSQPLPRADAQPCVAG